MTAAPSRYGRVSRVGAFLTALLLVLLSGCAAESDKTEAAFSFPGHHAVTVNDVDIKYFDFNPEAEGATILFLHGYSGTGYEAFFFHDDLGPDVRVIAPDLPGLGYSGKPPVEYDLSYYLRFLRGFVEELGLGRFVLAGHSMGGKISAVYAALDGAELLEGLILLAPYGLDGEAGEILEFLSNTGSLVDVSFNLYSRRLMDIAVRLNVFHDAQKIPEDLVDYISRATFSTEEGVKALSSITRNAIARDPVNWLLPEISVATLIIWGENDRVLSYRHAETFHSLIRASRLISVPDCGHMPHVEQQEMTGRSVVTFLESVGLSPSPSPPHATE